MNRKSVSAAAKENPGALAGATGADNYKAGELRVEYTPKPAKTAISKYGQKAHRAVARAIGYALTLGENFDAWADFSAILSIRLTIPERAMLARAVLRSLPEDVLGLVIDSLEPGPEPVDPRITEAAIEYRRSQGLPNLGVRA